MKIATEKRNIKTSIIKYLEHYDQEGYCWKSILTRLQTLIDYWWKVEDAINKREEQHRIKYCNNK